MNIKQVTKADDYSACTGDLLIVEDRNGTEQYLLFCETGVSTTAFSSGEGCTDFYFVDIEDGFMFKYELHNDEEIKIGFEIEGSGKVKKIISNDNIDLLLHESR